MIVKAREVTAKTYDLIGLSQREIEIITAVLYGVSWANPPGKEAMALYDCIKAVDIDTAPNPKHPRTRVHGYLVKESFLYSDDHPRVILDTEEQPMAKADNPLRID